jgi:uncharacterized membrane protein (DUF2068 family)
MKTNIVGWLYIIVSPIFLLSFMFLVVFPIIFQGGIIDNPNQPLIGILSLFLGVFGIIWGSSLRRHKKWAWYVGMVIVPLVAAYNLFTLVSNFELSSLIPLSINIFSFYALVSEKELFFTA